MDTLHLLGYIASLLIGLSLGLIGGGGSILTMPVLVYLFGISPVTATSYSLFVVGSSSIVGAARQYRQGEVNVRMALLFSATSVVAVFLTRKWLLPAIPEHFGTVHGFLITNSWLIMLLFAVLMLFSAVFMMRQKTVVTGHAIRNQGISIQKMVLYGMAIGLVTGLLGAGGGFLLIPALVLLLHLPMKEAVGTSLLVIALNSLIGFASSLDVAATDWQLLLKLTALAVLGILAGSYLNKKIAPGKLKTVFAWFVLLMGAYILIKELAVLL